MKYTTKEKLGLFLIAVAGAAIIILIPLVGSRVPPEGAAAADTSDVAVRTEAQLAEWMDRSERMVERNRAWLARADSILVAVQARRDARRASDSIVAVARAREALRRVPAITININQTNYFGVGSAYYIARYGGVR